MNTFNMIYLCSCCNSKHKKGLLTDYVKENKSTDSYHKFMNKFHGQLSQLVSTYKKEFPVLLNLEEDLNTL